MLVVLLLQIHYPYCVSQLKNDMTLQCEMLILTALRTTWAYCGFGRTRLFFSVLFSFVQLDWSLINWRGLRSGLLLSYLRSWWNCAGRTQNCKHKRFGPLPTIQWLSPWRHSSACVCVCVCVRASACLAAVLVSADGFVLTGVSLADPRRCMRRCPWAVASHRCSA